MSTSDSDQNVRPDVTSTALSRRQFLRYASIFSGSLALAACSSAPAAQSPTALPATTGAAQSASPVTAATVPGDTNSANFGAVKIAFGGGACDAATLIGYENGFFEREGMKPELVALAAGTQKEAVASDRVNALQYAADSIKAIEQGLGVRITTGLHKGCIRLLAGVDTGITKVADIKGKSVGITNFGGLPQVLVQWALGDLGLDPINDVTYKIFPPEQLESAVQKGEIQAFAMYDPLAAIALNNKTVIQVFSTHDDSPYKEMYCCFLGISQKVVEQEPEKAAAITRAFQKSAYWVQHNKPEAAKIIIAKKYVPASEELLLSLLNLYDYVPSATIGKVNFGKFAEILKRVGVLDKDTDPAKLVDLAFIQTGPDLYPATGFATPNHEVPQFSARAIKELAENPQLAASVAHVHAESSFYCTVS